MVSSPKIKTLRRLMAIVRKLKKQGKKIAFTNGCFDILHYGHLKYLLSAKKISDILIVAVNSDSSIRKIKGKLRPLNKQSDRLNLLGALECIDYITLFNQPTPLSFIKKIKPDFLIKGGDWQADKIIGGDFVKKYGGKAVVIPYLKGYSTTNLINKIINVYTSDKKRQVAI